MRKLLAALVVIGGLVLASFSAPALATPTNTLFDRTVSGCDYEFEYGNAFGTPYAEVRVNGADPTGYQCYMGGVDVYSASGSNHDLTQKEAPASACNFEARWCDNNVWHQVQGPTAYAAYAMNAYITTFHNGCWDSWVLQASIYDGVPEGKWTSHTQTGC